MNSFERELREEIKEKIEGINLKKATPKLIKTSYKDELISEETATELNKKMETATEQEMKEIYIKLMMEYL